MFYLWYFLGAQFDRLFTVYCLFFCFLFVASTKIVQLFAPNFTFSFNSLSLAGLCTIKALLEAAAEGDIQQGRGLLTYGAEINFAEAENGHTPMIAACSNAQPVMAHFLLLNNAIKDQADMDGNTPLHHAVQSKDFPTVCVLIKVCQ